MTRAIAYLRVSSAGQAEDGVGLEVQRERVDEFARGKGYALLDVVEEAASGGVREDEVFSWEHRPVLLDVMERAAAGEFDTLLVARLDRLSRDHVTLVVLERQLQRHGVTVQSVAEQHNGDGALAEFIRGQLGLVAQLERAMIRDRLGAGKAKRKAQGRHVHGRVPYGYTTAEERGVLKPDPELVPVLRSIFQDVRDGYSVGRIARRLNEEKVAAPQGKSWNPEGVRVLVRNPVYTGERHGIKKAHEGIVSRRVWNEAQAALQARARKPANE